MIIQTAINAASDALKNYTDLGGIIPVSRWGSTLVGRGKVGIRPYRLLANGIYKGLKVVINNHNVNIYAEALNRNDRKAINKYYDKLTPKQRKEAFQKAKEMKRKSRKAA